MTRENRATEERTERRKKRGETVLSGINLAVDESKLDRNNYEYRWVNDKGARMAQMHADDWDPAPEGAVLGSDEDVSAQSKVVGTDEGKPYRAVLMRKRKQWYAEDQKEKQRPLDEMDNAIRRGANHQKEAPELSGDVAYTPNGVNTISR
jgi:hypothetical protein